ncbi:MAG: ABC transporter permease [Oscillospiraceae bacterium]
MGLFRYKDHKTQQLADALSKAPTLSEEEKFQFADYDPSAGERGGYSNYSYWGATIRVFLKNKVAVFFLCVIVATLLFTFLQPYLPGQKEADVIYMDPISGQRATNVAPNDEYIFGTNDIGQDMWSQIWAGTRTSLGIGFAVACVEALLGVLVGVLWGYVRKLDFFFTELYNIFDNVPQTLVLIIISYILRPGIGTMIFAMCLTSWLATARFVRNQIVIIRDRDYNLASRCLGTGTGRIIGKNLLPYLVSIITLRMALAIPAAIGNEVFINYIGLGLPPKIPSLGNLIEAGRRIMMEPTLRYQLIFPVIILSIVTISFYIIGNSFADAADPKNHV